MRLILAPVGPSEAPMPSAALLEEARDLPGRFPDAGVRPVAVVRAPDLDRDADPTGKTRVWLGLEALQTTGSFKVRGALFALARMPKGTHVVAASAGNHGAGIAFAARALGMRATVVVPSSAPRAKRSKIERYGAEVVLSSSPHYDDAEALARDLASRPGSVFVSPYDDLAVLTGNGASLGYEIVRAMRGVPEVAIVPFGGGGLATGLACALADEASDPLARVRHVWGVQSESSSAMARSLESGTALERLELTDETLAEGLEGGISKDAFARARAAIAGVVVVSEASISRAMAYAYRELGLVLEGSAATALVPLLEGLPPAMRGADAVAIVTGRNVDPHRLEQVLSDN